VLYLDLAPRHVQTSSRSKGMYNLYARVNNGFAFMSSCLMAMLAAIALSSFLFTADPKGQLTIFNFKVYAPALQYTIRPAADNWMQCRCEGRFPLPRSWTRSVQPDRRFAHHSQLQELPWLNVSKILHRYSTGTRNNCSFMSLQNTITQMGYVMTFEYRDVMFLMFMVSTDA
jgi:hypothetical protein